MRPLIHGLVHPRVSSAADVLEIYIDGASDVSGIENETIHCKMVQNGRAVTRLIGHKAVENANATGKN